MTKFVNEKRQCGFTKEGLGPDAYIWRDYEVLCPCGNWTDNYGDISRQVGDDPDVHQWLCPDCCGESRRREANELGMTGRELLAELAKVPANSLDDFELLVVLEGKKYQIFTISVNSFGERRPYLSLRNPDLLTDTPLV